MPKILFDGFSDEQENALRDKIGQKDLAKRLEYLRAELRAERISMSELLELQELAEQGHLKGDLELQEAAGVPESEAV